VEEWDGIMGVHLKGAFNVSRHAAAYFRQTGKADPSFKGRIINTASDAGLLGNVGQSNYGAAKAGVAAFTIILARELRKYATVNCIVPIARTRLTTEATPGMTEMMSIKSSKGLDIFDPKNVPPMIVYLLSDDAADVTGHVFRIAGDTAYIFQGWHTINQISNDGERFTAELLAKRVKSELLKDLPPQGSLAEAIKELSEH
jgi:NAD(P)-dependent dehydrogenase (short-subunit alcohol dehydrogenase family)